MNRLADVIDGVEQRRKTIEVYATDPEDAADVEAQFATRNVRVVKERLPPIEAGFVLVRDADDRFARAMSLDAFRRLLSPEVRLPWKLTKTDTESADVFDFLQNTVFTSYDRRQMLAATREIEERAWRVDGGTLYVGFQNTDALAAQTSVYGRFARDSGVTVRVFVEDDPVANIVDVDVDVDVIVDDGGEIGEYWFLVFDGDGNDLQKCALLAEERSPGRYYGFWTYDPWTVDDVVSHLRSHYGVE